MIFEGSRYQSADMAAVADVTGVYHVTVFRTLPDVPPGLDLALVREGLRLDTLADRLLGDAELWWQIADLNPEIRYPDDIPVGTLLRIPRATDR